MDSDAFTISRLWVVFFRERDRYWWFDRWLDPGFRHVSAAAWYPQAERWVFFDPTARATALLVLPDGPEADALMGQWAMQSGAILRVRSGESRSLMPPFFGCVGAMKALLGVNCARALVPRQLHDQLLAQGAEIVPLPRSEHGEPLCAGPTPA